MKMYPFRTFDGELSFITSATGNLLIGAFGEDELKPHLLDETATFLARQYGLIVYTANELMQMVPDPVQLSEDSDIPIKQFCSCDVPTTSICTTCGEMQSVAVYCRY